MIEYVAVGGTDRPGQAFAVFKDDRYFADVYRPIHSRFPTLGYDPADTNLHTVIGVDGHQFSMYVASAQVATFIEQFALLSIAPF